MISLPSLEHECMRRDVNGSAHLTHPLGAASNAQHGFPLSCSSSREDLERWGGAQLVGMVGGGLVRQIKGLWKWGGGLAGGGGGGD